MSEQAEGMHAPHSFWIVASVSLFLVCAAFFGVLTESDGTGIAALVTTAQGFGQHRNCIQN